MGSGSCHSEEQGLRPHKELFDGRGRAGVRAGPGQAPREPTPLMGRGAPHPCADNRLSPHLSFQDWERTGF